ncbi:MAG: hypothetical protein LR000_01720 [Candidatus Pacebacteria bacterium]|nr:hypothetical protein [Candidatus Paceibacterota bacterium]
MKQQWLSENKKEKGIVLLTSVIVLAGIILVLIVGSYYSINAIRWYVFSYPRASQSLLNAESCAEVVISKLRISPAYFTNSWQEIKNDKITCKYLIQEGNGEKIIKTESSFSDYFKKILISLKTINE